MINTFEVLKAIAAIVGILATILMAANSLSLGSRIFKSSFMNADKAPKTPV